MQLYSLLTGLCEMNLDMIEYKAMCCTFSTTSIQQLWIGASKGTLLFYDLPGTPCFHIRPTRIFYLESFTSVPVQPPVQCVGHLSGRAGCFYDEFYGRDDESVKGMTIMTQAGKVWVLEGCSVENTVAPLDFFTTNKQVIQMESCYDVRVVDITTSTLPDVSTGSPLNKGQKTHIVACLLVSSKADPVRVSRFLLHRRDGRWVGVLLTEFSGHSVIMSLPRPVAAYIPDTDNPSSRRLERGDFREGIEDDLKTDRYRYRNTLVVGCPESSGFMRVWVESLRNKFEFIMDAVMEDYRIQVPSQVLSMTFINPVKDSNLCDVIDLRSGEGAGTGGGTGVGVGIGVGIGAGRQGWCGSVFGSWPGKGVETGVAVSTAAVTDINKKNGNVILRILATTPESVYLYSMTMLEYDHFVTLNRNREGSNVVMNVENPAPSF